MSVSRLRTTLAAFSSPCVPTPLRSVFVRGGSCGLASPALIPALGDDQSFSASVRKRNL